MQNFCIQLENFVFGCKSFANTEFLGECKNSANKQTFLRVNTKFVGEHKRFASESKVSQGNKSLASAKFLRGWEKFF